MNDLFIEIPSEILAYAKLTYTHYVPIKRASGFEENANQTRGDGDLSDLLASLTLHHLIGKNKRVFKMDLSSGCGDDDDLSIRIDNKWQSVNIKTSLYAPYREGLHLYVKKEELSKDIDYYVQCFVHLNEKGFAPHIHVAGWVKKNGEIWNSAKEIKIPTTEHYGIGIPVSKLEDFKKLVCAIDKKF